MNLKFLLAALLVFAPFARAANPSYGSFETATQFATNNLRIAIKDGVIVTNILAWTGSVEERLRIGGVLSFDHGEFLLPAATNDISVFDASYYRLISDDNTATNRIVRLSAGSFDGQFVILENGADTRFLLRDSDTTWDTGDQVYMVADWSPTNRQSLILLWDGVDTSWIEQERVGTFGGGGELQGTLTPTFIPFANGVTTLGDSGLYSITFTQLGLGDQWTNSFLANNGTQNTWLGNNAGSSLTTASQSVGVGFGALDSATSSSNNVAVGYNALTALTTGGAGTTAIGHSALAAATSTNNTAVGFQAGKAITTGVDNTAVGYNALTALNGAFEYDNVAIGASALAAATLAHGNTAIGARALLSNEGGDGHTAVGYDSLRSLVDAGNGGMTSNEGFGRETLYSLTNGLYNGAFGGDALYSLLEGTNNIGIGGDAGANLIRGNNNIAIGVRADGNYSSATHHDSIAIGYEALRRATTGSQNIAIGSLALDSATTSSNNVAVGYNALTAVTTGAGGLTALGHSALEANTSGVNNVAVGDSALESNTTGNSNVAVGNNALLNNITGVENVAVGRSSLSSLTAGVINTAVGDQAGQSLTTGNDNAMFGNDAGIASTTTSYGTFLGASAGSSHQTDLGPVYVGRGAGSRAINGAYSVVVGAANLNGFVTGATNIHGSVSIGGHEFDPADAMLTNSVLNTILIGHKSTAQTNAMSGYTNIVLIAHDLVPTNNNAMYLGNRTNAVLFLGQDRSLHWGTGSPEAAVTANTGSLFLRDDGSTATSLYIKTANDSANTGWTAVDPTGGGGGGTLWEYASDTLRPIADPTRITITTNRQMTLGRATSIPADLTYVLESGRFRDLGDNARSQFYLWNASDATFVDIVDFSLDMTSSATVPYSQLSISAQKATGSNSVFVVRTDNDVTDRIQFNVNGTARIDMLPNTADGSGAVAYTFDTANYLDDAGAQLARFRNFGTNKFVVGPNGELNVLGAAITTPSPAIGITNIWNDAADTFTLIKANVTDTASAAASLLMDLQVGGTSKALFDKSGVLALGGAMNTPSTPLIRHTTGSNSGYGFYTAGVPAIHALGAYVMSWGISGAQINMHSSYALGWTSGTATGTPDLLMSRESAATQQWGADSTIAIAQTLKAHDGSGTDKAGADFKTSAGKSTGSAVGGSRIDETSLTGSTGSSLNSYSTRRYIYAGEKTLTSATATIVLNLALASSKYVGGRITATTHANDASDFQAITDDFTFSAVNKAGTVTTAVQVTPSTSTTAASAGTLTTAWTVVANGNGLDIKNTADSSLTETVLKVTWQIELNSDDVATVTP